MDRRREACPKALIYTRKEWHPCIDSVRTTWQEVRASRYKLTAHNNKTKLLGTDV